VLFIVVSSFNTCLSFPFLAVNQINASKDKWKQALKAKQVNFREAIKYQES